MCIFAHSEFILVFLGKIVRKNFGTAIFGHSKLMPVFLSEKNWNGQFWPFQIYTSLFGENCRKIQNCHFWPFQINTSLFGKNCQNKFRIDICGHSEFIPVCFGKIVGKKMQNGHFWPF